MSNKKNLIIPKLQKQNLGKVNPQKAEYLYISKACFQERKTAYGLQPLGI